jgi:hypothetical protein
LEEWIYVSLRAKGNVQDSDDNSGDNTGYRVDSVRDMGVYGATKGKERAETKDRTSGKCEKVISRVYEKNGRL